MKQTEGREREREVHYMVVCDRLCLHEVICDACMMFVSLFMCTVCVSGSVCVCKCVLLNGAAHSG